MDASGRDSNISSSESNKSISETLVACKERILKTWERNVLKELPVARHKDRSALRDHLPQFLDQIAAALRAGKIPEDLAEGGTKGTEHGRERSFLKGYTLDQVLMEFRLFKSAIMEVLAKEATITKDTAEIIWDIISLGITDTANEFTEIHLARERKSNFQLEEDRRVRERFVLTLSHDLRNPLTAIKTSLRLIRKYPEKIEAHERLLAQIDKNVDRAAQMLDDLLDANQIHAGKRLPLLLASCELNIIAEEVIEELELQYGQRFTFQAPHSIWGVWSSAGLRRVIENLLNNAVKYGDPNEKITITLGERDSDANLSVHNWGPPIMQEQQIKLFAPFQRSDAAEKSGERGWGLGLTIVRGITESLGGQITVKSSLEDGTIFSITLPKDSRPGQGPT